MIASLKYYLKEPKKDTTSIYFLLNYGAYEIVNGKKKHTPFKYYIGQSINPKLWDKNKEQAIRKGFPQHSEFNMLLANIKNEVLNIVRRLSNDEEQINNETLKKEVDKLFNKQTANEVEALELMDFIKYYIDTCNRKIGTLKSYKRVEKDLQEYEALYKTNLTYDSINVDFHNKFIKYLQSKEYAPNTIGTRIKVIKTFMSEAYERNLHTNIDFKKKSFSKPKEETTSIYLNIDELDKIYNLNLTNNKTLDSVRDWFIIGANTGLRFSDLSRIKKENIQNDTIRITTQKTDKLVVIPITNQVKEILEKYEYNLPRIISNQKFNEYIKEVAKLAEISENILVEETKGTTKAIQTKQKYELVTTHTARRSFATNAFKAGVPSIQIMKITGHKTEKAFLGYIKVSETENAEILKAHSFFNR